MSALPQHHWFGTWFGRPVHRPQAFREQLERARLALRAGDIVVATSLLDACSEAADTDANCLNLRGIIAERRGDWSLARKCWVCAARADKGCLAARRNLARYYELFTWGRCRDAAALGDEPEFQR